MLGRPPFLWLVGWCLTTLPVTKTIRLSEWVTPGSTAIPGVSPSLRLVTPGIAVPPGVTHSDSRIVFRLLFVFYRLPVSKTETFNTQVHWLNLQRRYRAPTIRQKLIRNRTASRSRSDGRSRRNVQYRRYVQYFTMIYACFGVLKWVF